MFGEAYASEAYGAISGEPPAVAFPGAPLECIDPPVSGTPLLPPSCDPDV